MFSTINLSEGSYNKILISKYHVCAYRLRSMQHFTILPWKHSERSFLSVPVRIPWNPLVIWWRWAVERTIPRTWPVFSEMVCVQPADAYLKIRYGELKTIKSIKLYRYSSVQFSCSVVSDSLGPHEPQHIRPPCPSPTPGVHPNSCSLSWWCHLTISSSVVSFSSCPQSFPA